MALSSSQQALVDKAIIREQLGGLPSELSFFKFFSNNIKIGDFPLVLVVKETDDTTIARFNQSYFGDGKKMAGYPEQSLGSELIKRVVNLNNTFKEYFLFDDYIDTASTTGTIDLTNHKVTMSSGQYLTSKIVFKNLENINNVICNYTASSSINISVSFNDGSTWLPIILNTQLLSGTDIGQDLLWKAEAVGSSGELSYLELQYNR